MEKYTKAQMEVIEFEREDVITTSGDGPSIGGTTEGGPDIGYGGNTDKCPGETWSPW